MGGQSLQELLPSRNPGLIPSATLALGLCSTSCCSSCGQQGLFSFWKDLTCVFWVNWALQVIEKLLFPYRFALREEVLLLLTLLGLSGAFPACQRAFLANSTSRETALPLWQFPASSMEFSGGAGYALWKSRRSCCWCCQTCFKGEKSLGTCLPPLNRVRTANPFIGYIAHADVFTAALFGVSKVQIEEIFELLRFLLSDVARSQICSWICVTGLQLEEGGFTRLFSWKSFGRFFPTVKEMPSMYFFFLMCNFFPSGKKFSTRQCWFTLA